MLPAETDILRKIHLDKKWPNELEYHHDTAGEYINYVIASFIKRGMVRRNWSGSYYLTETGKNMIPM
jgi:predicted transcriptional regulator